MTAIALFFSTFSSPLLSAALTFGLYVIGHFNADLQELRAWSLRVGAVAWPARALYYLLPNLAPFDVKAEVVHGLAVYAGLRRADGRYADSCTSPSLLFASTLIFSRKDFK